MPSVDLSALEASLAAAAPIVGFTVGDYTDKSTWRVEFDPSATPAQQAAAQSILAAFDAGKASLVGYANAKQWALAVGGFSYTLNGSALQFQTDTTSQALITGQVVAFMQPNAPAAVQWQFPSGFVTVAAADFIAAAGVIAAFIQATFNALATILASIASGTITTTAQIDAAAWPANHN